MSGEAQRRAAVERATAETRIAVTLDLDGSGRHRIATGIGFFDHMLAQLSRHSLIDLEITADGDLHIDAHHTVEDTGLALGTALAKALGDRAGIQRFGHAYAPLDEALTRVVVDLSGRPHLTWQVAFTQPALGGMDTELFREFHQALAQTGGLTLHVEALAGINNHHIAESGFKALARALKAAIAHDPRQAGRVPSTKGTLTGGAPPGAGAG